MSDPTPLHRGMSDPTRLYGGIDLIGCGSSRDSTWAMFGRFVPGYPGEDVATLSVWFFEVWGFLDAHDFVRINVPGESLDVMHP